MTPALHTKTGQLTAYALACGYVQTFTTKNGETTIKLFHRDNCYFIRSVTDRPADRRTDTLTATTHAAARYLYNTMKRTARLAARH